MAFGVDFLVAETFFGVVYATSGGVGVCEEEARVGWALFEHVGGAVVVDDDAVAVVGAWGTIADCG